MIALIPLVILGISFVVHFMFLGRPASVVFDEVFYGNFISDYWHGLYFFDQHPPFFKLMMTGIGYVTGASNYLADWTNIGNPVPSEILVLRLVPIIIGTILPLIIYALCRRLNFSKLTSTVASLLICFENSLVVQSRYILPDIIMMFFGFSTILLYLEYRHRVKTKNSRWFLFGSILCATATLSTKWTGLAFLLVIFAMELYRLYEEKFITRAKFKVFLKKMSGFMASYIGVAFVIYILLFAVHFSLLPYSGAGDVFMSNEFQKTLIGNENTSNTSVKARGFFGKFVELNQVMYSANSTMTATHSYSSKWYTWPLSLRGVFYWESTAGVHVSSVTTAEPHSYIYYLGNPVIYWLGALSILSLLVYSLCKRSLNKVSFFLLVGFFVNFLPFALIGRVMFLYHYEASLIFSIIAIAYALDFLNTKNKKIAAGAILLLAVAAFIYWSPLTYGLPLSDKALAQHMWISSWR